MRVLFLVFVVFSSTLKAQNTLGLEYQRNLERVNLSNFKDLILSNSSFLLTKSLGPYRFGYGLEIQEAVSGEFGGLYVFGLTSDFDYKIKKLPISLNFNGFIGGGGGASAPDGSGLAHRYAFGFKAHFSQNSSLLARYSLYDFPTGNIGGNQIQLGFSYGFKGIFNSNIISSSIAKQSVSVHSMFVKLDANDSNNLDADYTSKFISVQYASYINEKVEGLIRLQAAISSQIDGFMGYYSGLSFTALKQKYFSWKFSTLLGSCGGGAMNTSGGLAYLLETGIDFTFLNQTLSISRGYNASYMGSFSANYVQFGIKYNFESSILFGSKGEMIDSFEGFKQNNISVKTGLEVHHAPNAIDYNGLLYENMSLIYFGLSYPIHNKLDILGETRWAMGGNYGAYAEGIIGFSTPLFKYRKLSINCPVKMVVAGGGGINVGKGVGIQLNLSADYQLSNTGSFSFTIGKLNMIDGNYNPVSLNFSIKQNLSFYKR